MFERRDIILLVGAIMLAIGMIPFTTPAFAIITAAAVFVGIKWFSRWRKRRILLEAGLGFCAECGSAVTKYGCPQCNNNSNTKSIS
ncbi:MAG: hypothetical protein F4Y82_06990 [Cenarchaeum sp. SB0665_bin_23]|nr:hypothetical protein [Cenarchaeum sp. SB0665_bin_23]MYG33795.1 hypothetical protein [Cenarchaeum sp. SB0677_bin_16]